ncbi:MAG TPA: ATP-dependent Clp protease ATP-binding subunit, partial [Clostridiales bacterium]|nr:ATP-dependent Clp protease ATP-binding subunit [Clostridiales bacterium]
RTQNEQNRERLMKALEDFLRPEFINRIDEIITFNTLTKENFKDIANLMLTEMQEALSERGIKLNFNEEVTAYLAEKSFSGKFGARNLRRFIQKEVEDKAAARIIAAANRPVSALKVSVDSSGIIVTEED